MNNLTIVKNRENNWDIIAVFSNTILSTKTTFHEAILESFKISKAQLKSML